MTDDYNAARSVEISISCKLGMGIFPGFRDYTFWFARSRIQLNFKVPAVIND